MRLRMFLIVLGGLLVVAVAGCTEPFTSATQIQSQRFLGIAAEPLETAPGSAVTFKALVTDKDGSLYEGPIAWAIVGGSGEREGGRENVNPEDVYLQMPGDPPFTWQVPGEDEIRQRYGGIEQNGVLLTVTATAFKNGDPTDEPITAFKLFVVSLRPEESRMTNVALEEIKVSDPSGALAPDADGVYHTTADKVSLHAVAESNDDHLTYHWFSTAKDFAPDLEAVQKLKPKHRGDKSVYCVLRRSYWFVHDDDSKTRVTGLDWQRVEIEFE